MVNINWFLFLDGVRFPMSVSIPDSFMEVPCIVARNVDDAKFYCSQFGSPKFMSLDYDLGDNRNCVEFLEWMRSNFSSPPCYHVHSSSCIGSASIVAFMDNWNTTS